MTLNGKQQGDNVMMNDFIIRIEHQDWLSPGYADEDLCSHGLIFLKVQDTVITSPEAQEKWGISESALALLRTLRYNHPATPGQPISETLIFHGCGALLMSGCPVSIDWKVVHRGHNVVLSDFVKFPTTNIKDAVNYTELHVDIPLPEYRDQVLPFAIEAKRLFQDSNKKKLADEYDAQMYQAFWDEYNALLKLAETV